MWHPMDIARPRKLGFWLDVFFSKIGLLCSACGWWKWESPCFALKHWGGREKDGGAR